jgi:N-acetylglucosaminyl-diphospho-decaprenol L-rhamnosyltransferase
MNEGQGVDVSIVIVNWNSRGYVEKCVASIETNVSGVSYEVIVVDSGSFDGCEGMLHRAYPKVRFIQGGVNLGFGQASTLGAGHARGSVLLFLNPDTELTPGAIERMYQHIMDLAEAGALGCRLLNSDGSLQVSCVQALPTIVNQLLDADVIRPWFRASRLFGTRALFSDGASVAEVEAVSGACMMLRREVFDVVGGFSPEYFMYGEDLDLCFKARSKGLHNYHVRDAVVRHYGGGSSQHTVSRFSAVMMVDSVNRFLCKSRGAAYGRGHRLVMVWASVVRLVVLGLMLSSGVFLGAKSARVVAARRWLFVLRWGLGLERWTAAYNGSPVVSQAVRGAGTSCAGSAES